MGVQVMNTVCQVTNGICRNLVFEGATIGTPLFRDVLHVLKRIVDFPIKELTRTHQKTIFILEIRDVSHPFPLSNLIISRNVQFLNKESFILHDSPPSSETYIFQGERLSFCLVPRQRGNSIGIFSEVIARRG